MKNKELTVTISGETNSGKSNLTYILAKFLRDADIDVKIENIDFPGESLFTKFDSENINNTIATNKILREQTTITFKEVGVNKKINIPIPNIPIFNPPVEELETLLDSINTDSINIGSTLADLIKLSPNFIINKDTPLPISTSYLFGKYKNTEVIIDPFIKFDDLSIVYKNNTEITKIKLEVDLLDLF